MPDGIGRKDRSQYRFWDIDSRHDKSGLVGIEAATENQGLHPRIPALLEASEAGQTGSWAHSGGGCQTGFPPSVVCIEIRIWGAKSRFCGIAASREDLREASQILRNLVGPFTSAS
jgi:hypothetical protein